MIVRATRSDSTSATVELSYAGGTCLRAVLGSASTLTGQRLDVGPGRSTAALLWRFD